MSAYLSSRIESDERIKLWTHTEIRSLAGESSLATVTVTKDGKEHEISTRALFIMVGAAPNTDWLGDQLALDSKGFVLTGSDANVASSPFATSCPGI